jgi:hypothetical protein
MSKKNYNEYEYESTLSYPLTAILYMDLRVEGNTLFTLFACRFLESAVKS